MRKLFSTLMLLIFAVFFFANIGHTARIQKFWGDGYFKSNIVVDGYIYNELATYNPIVNFVQPEASSATAYDSFSISTATLKAGTTTLRLASVDYTDVITPRNLVFRCDFAGDESTMTVVASVLVTGKNARGESVTETIAFSTNTGTGNIPFSTVTSIAYSATTIVSGATGTTAILTMGSGTKIGLPADLGASTEVLKVIENKALTTTYTLNTTYDTIEFVNAPDGSKHYAVYLKPELR